MHFSKLHQVLNIFKKRWQSWLMYLRNYGRRKTWLDKCLKSPVSEDHSIGNMVNGPKHWFSVNSSTFYIFIDKCQGNNWKRSLLVACKVVILFVDTPTTDDMYSPLSRHILMQWMQMHSSEKENTFSQFFCAFFESTSNFEHFQRKNDPHSFCISEITDTEIRG